MTVKEEEKINIADVKTFREWFYRLCMGYTYLSRTKSHRWVYEYQKDKLLVYFLI